MTGKLSGKVAIVTGAARGIGAAIAKRLAQDGAAVAITYSASSAKAEELIRTIEAAGGRALAIKADAANPAETQGAIAKIVEQLGGLDIFVNNAGTLAVAPIEQIPLAEFDRVININIRGMYAATQEAVRHLRDNGRIILLGSCNSDRVPFQGGSVYALTKSAVIGFTKGLARDLGPRGITVNNIQPGPTDTDMNPAQGPFAASTVANVALQRYAQPHEIADLIAFVAGPEASYITGASLLVDGGYCA